MKLVGNKEIEDSLERLDRLTQEEAQMASAEQLKMTHGVDGKVMGVDDKVRGVEEQVEGVRDEVEDVGNKVEDVGDKVQCVDGRVQDVGDRVQDVDNRVQHVGDKVQGVDGRVQDVGNKVEDVDDRVQDVRNKIQDVNERVKGIGSNVRGLDDKLDQANRSLSFPFLTQIVIPRTQTVSQGTTSEIVFYDGFHPQIHPRTIILHAKPITTVQLNGFFKELYSIPGNLLAPSCGSTENVGYS